MIRAIFGKFAEQTRPADGWVNRPRHDRGNGQRMIYESPKDHSATITS
jgi:hypothetical protein